jgi:predicted DNA-binding protein with PD1-like motif
LGTVQGKAGRVIIANLQRGSDLLESLEKVADESGVVGGVFTAIGAVGKAAFTFYDQANHKYVNINKNEELEIVSCSGNFGVLDGRPRIHCHVVFSDRDGRAFGGHLMRGTEVFVGEVHLVEVDGVKLERKVDSVTGIAMLSF